MSKAMAIEAIMKIFLMVAVIIVGMAFLTKAFGVDLLGWLQNMFGGFDIPDKGYAIHVKGDEADPSGEIWAFELIEKRQDAVHHSAHDEGFGTNPFFFPGELPTDRCVLFVNDEGSLGSANEAVDNGGYYYVYPGAKIDDTCSSPYECIKSKLIDPNPVCIPKRITKAGEGDKCVRGDVSTICQGGERCAGPNAYVNCYGEVTFLDLVDRIGCIQNNFVLSIPFDDETLLAHDPCAKGDLCNLLDRSALENNKGLRGYKIKYGVLCGSDGVWHTCKNSAESDFGEADCDFNGDVGIWTKTGPDISPIQQPPKSANLQVKGSVDLGELFEISFTAEDDNGDLKSLYLNLDHQGNKNYCLLQDVDIPKQTIDDRQKVGEYDCSNEGVACSTKFSIICNTIESTYAFQGIAFDSTGSYKVTEIKTVTLPMRSSLSEPITESIDRWSGRNTAVYLDSSDRIMGYFSIRGESNDVYMVYTSQNPFALSELLVLIKSDVSTDVKVILRDFGGDQVQKLITGVTTSFQNTPLSINKDEFSKNSAFDWNSVSEIHFEEVDYTPSLTSAKKLWIDGLTVK